MGVERDPGGWRGGVQNQLPHKFPLACPLLGEASSAWPQGTTGRGERRVRKADENLSREGGMQNQLHIICPPKVPGTKKSQRTSQSPRTRKRCDEVHTQRVPEDEMQLEFSEPQCVVEQNENAARVAGVTGQRHLKRPVYPAKKKL